MRHLADVRSAVPSASGGIVFTSGPLATKLREVAELVRSAWRGVPACIVPAAGVLSERGEIEGESAASGVLWAGGRVAPFALGQQEPAPGQALREVLAGAAIGRAATAILFVRPDALGPDLLEALASPVPGVPGACLFGAGTLGASALCVTASGEVVEGAIAGLALSGLAPPIVGASPACRLLSSFEPIEEASGGLVLRAGGRAALELLAASTADLTRQPDEKPLVFAALADAPAPPGDASADTGGTGGAGDLLPRFVIRPIRGVDPARRAVMIGDAARVGARLAFAVRDAAAARAGLDAVARQTAQAALGSAPRFALYLTCAGRGQGLYGAPDVEARILRQRFADLPIAGMHSSFEITPGGPGQARLALYTGVFALFRAPS